MRAMVLPGSSGLRAGELAAAEALRLPDPLLNVDRPAGVGVDDSSEPGERESIDAAASLAPGIDDAEFRVHGLHLNVAVHLTALVAVQHAPPGQVRSGSR